MHYLRDPMQKRELRTPFIIGDYGSFLLMKGLGSIRCRIHPRFRARASLFEI